MFELVIGSKNFSSWSLRPWLLMKAFDIPFEETLIPLRQADTKSEILKHSPSGFVPALKTGGLTICDSLAIMEYLADRYPEKTLWPESLEDRAIGRMMCAEMHGGFQALRQQMPMDFTTTFEPQAPSPEVQTDIDRILALWQQALARKATGGAYLLGGFGIVDAMFAPVVSRFRSYGVEVTEPAADYMDLIWRHPAMQSWYQGASLEV